MIERDDYVLLADVSPLGADQRVTWTSSDPDIAIVDSRGHIWAISKGIVTIKATSITDPSKFATCAIEVIDDTDGINVAVTGFALTPHMATLSAAGATLMLSGDVSPVDASDKTIIWESDNLAVASVSQSGKVYPLSAGVATITAKTADGGYTDTCDITVTDNSSAVVDPGVVPDDINISSTTQTILTGDSYSLLSEVTPVGADQSVTWTSSDHNVAIVTNFGEIIAKSVGDVVITARSDAKPTLSKTCNVKVIDGNTSIPVTGISLATSAKTMFLGDGDYLLTYTVSPVDATNQAISWTSSDPTVATVDSATGSVEAVSAGTATITATSVSDPSISATCALNVLAADVEPASVDEDSLTAFAEGQDAKLTWDMPGPGTSGGSRVGIIHYKVYCVEGTVTDTDYSSDVWSGAAVQAANVTSATVSGLSKGKTYSFLIVAENSFGEASSGAVVSVSIPDDVVDVVTVNGASSYVYKASDKVHTMQLSAVSSKGNPIVGWSVSPAGIASVSSSGVLSFTGAEGNVLVTARTAEATSLAKKIAVVKNVTSIATPMKTLYIQTGKSFTIPVVAYDGNLKVTPKLTWATSSSKIAKVVNGKVTVAKKLKKGKATITARAANGKVLSVKVNVSKKAVKLKSATVKAPKSLKVKASKFLTVKFKQKKATGIKITFKSSKASGLEVDKAGKLTAKKKGSYKITIKCGSKKVIKKIKVK
jgi:uncharacterized protein YjdB